MKKKAYLMVLALCAALAITACGTSTDQKDDKKPAAEAQDTTDKEDSGSADSKESEETDSNKDSEEAASGDTRLVSVDDVSKYVTIGEYKGLTLDNTVEAVTDDMVDGRIKEELQNKAEEVTEGSVQNGDVVTINYVGTKDGVAFDGGTANNYELTIGSGTFIDGFEDGIIGMKKGEFKRTSNRRDYALKPPAPTVLNALKDAGNDVIGVGKIHDIFCGEGITKTYHSESSVHGMEQTIDVCKEEFTGLCFVNLVDFDALWGHRRNVEGYGKEIEKFDEKLGVLLECLSQDDLLILTADHGNDPTYKGTDHTREYVPFLAYSKRMQAGGPLPEAETFAVIGATVAENFGVDIPKGTIGFSVLSRLQQ